MRISQIKNTVMPKTGFRLDKRKLDAKLKKLAEIPATVFKLEVSDFTRKSLSKEMRNTQVRPLGLIRFNQIEKPHRRNQYDRWMDQGGNPDGSISRREFLADRAPARFLFQLSWVQVAYSLGLNIPVSANVLSATTRNHNDPEPQKGYGQWRGGKNVFSAVIYNPFLETPRRLFKDFMGSEILGDAMRENQPVFKRAVDRKLKRVAYAIIQSE